MKPIRLTMNAFCSYAGKVDIPFEKLKGQGLYLITGNTGSGKTTIFDAICFALYGVASGEARKDDSLLRNDIAAPDKETYVEFEFDHAGKRYRVRRNPTYMRAAKRGAKTTEQKQGAVLYMPDGRPPIEKLTDVDREIERILGIKREHFSKITMIAQGDFAKLLLSSVEERRTILQNIFGTQYYERIGKILSERAASLKRDWENQKDRIQTGYVRAALPEGYEAAPSFAVFGTEGSAHRFDDWLALMHALIGHYETLLAAAQNERQEKQKASEDLILKREQAVRVNADFDSLAQASKSLERLMEEAEAVGAMKTSVAIAQAAMRVDPDAVLHEAAQNGLHETIQKINDAERELTKLNDGLPSLQDTLNTFNRAEPESRGAHREAENISNILPKYDKLAELDTELQNAQRAAMQAETRETDAQQEVNRLTAVKNKAAADRAGLVDAPAALEKKKAEADTSNGNLKALRKITEDLQKYEAGRKGFEELQRVLQNADHRQTELNGRLLKLRSAFLLNQAGLMAKDLLDGKPCPVCGSTSHPHKAELPDTAPTQAQVDEADAAFQQAWEDALKAKEKYQQMQTKRETEHQRITNEWQRYRTEELNLIMAGAAAQKEQEHLDRLTQEAGEQKAQADRFAKLEKLLPVCEEDLRQALANMQAASNQKGEAGKHHAAIAAQCAEYRKNLPYPTAQEAQNRHRQLLDVFNNWEQGQKAAQKAVEERNSHITAKQGQLSQLKDQRASQEKNVTQYAEQLERALKRENFADLKSFKAARRTQKEIDELTIKIQRHGDEIIKVQNEVTRLQGAVSGKTPADLHTLDEEKNAIAAILAKLQLKIDQLNADRRTNNGLVKEMSSYIQAFRELNDEYAMVQNLSDTANGKNVSDTGRQSFEVYVQSELFSEVIQFANQRFSQMTGGQYELVREDSYRNKKALFGLDLSVRDHFAGTQRPVHSLSGGETFMASLSLALGFADAVSSHSGGIMMDSMFVDEGFGTLDETTLDQVMNTLGKLAQGDKLVGVISHVADLRKRIDRQIVVKKERSGGSSALIVV